MGRPGARTRRSPVLPGRSSLPSAMLFLADPVRAAPTGAVTRSGPRRADARSRTCAGEKLLPAITSTGERFVECGNDHRGARHRPPREPLRTQPQREKNCFNPKYSAQCYPLPPLPPPVLSGLDMTRHVHYIAWGWGGGAWWLVAVCMSCGRRSPALSPAFAGILSSAAQPPLRQGSRGAQHALCRLREILVPGSPRRPLQGVSSAAFLVV